MVGAYQNLNGSRDLTLPLSGMNRQEKLNLCIVAKVSLLVSAKNYQSQLMFDKL